MKATPQADKRRRSPAQKAATAQARNARASARRRRDEWRESALAADKAGLPITAVLHVTWGALFANDGGPVLRHSEVGRERALWRCLRRAVTRHGVPWVAVRAPEHDAAKGIHLHSAAHVPEPAFGDVIAALERITGAPAAWVDLNGRRMRRGGRMLRGVVAISACGGWLLARNVRPESGGAVGALAYLTKAAEKGLAAGQYRRSNALAALTGKTAQEASQGASEPLGSPCPF